MQQPTEEPETCQIGTLAALLSSAEAALSQGAMLSDMQAKSLLDRECCDTAKRLNRRRPPCVLPICWDGEAWRHGQCWIDDRGLATNHAVPSFVFWVDLMRHDGPWVGTIGVEAARSIAMLLRHPEARTTCLKALGLLAPQDSLPDDQETERQFRRATKTLHKANKYIPAVMVANEEGPTSSRQAVGSMDAMAGFFEPEGVAK